MMEQAEAVRSPEEEKDVERKLEIANMLETMARTDGYEKVLVPYLQGMVKRYMDILLSAEDKDEILKQQQKIKVINNIFNFVDNNIAIGKSEGQRLYKESEEK